MKKWIVILLAMVMAISLVGCKKPDIEECVFSADQSVGACSPYMDSCYGFFTDFSKEEMTYTIVTYVDENEVERVVAGIQTDYPATVRAGTIDALDNDNELITYNLTLLKSAAEDAFEGTKVKIVTCHMDTDGKIEVYD